MPVLRILILVGRREQQRALEGLLLLMLQPDAALQLGEVLRCRFYAECGGPVLRKAASDLVSTFTSQQ